MVGCEVSGVSTPIRRTSVRSSTAGVTSTVSPSTTLLTVTTRPRSFRLPAVARGLSSSSADPTDRRLQARTAAPKDKTDHSRTKTLWFSPPHGRYRIIVLFRPEVRPAAGSLPAPSHQQGKAPPGSGGERSHFRLWHLQIWLTQTSRTLPMDVHLGLAVGQLGAKV